MTLRDAAGSLDGMLQRLRGGLVPLLPILRRSSAIFAVAVVLRLCGSGGQNLWYDEHCTLSVAAVPLAELPATLPQAEAKPPLYFALMHGWTKLGTSEFWLRLPSVVFGALDCVAAAAVGVQLFGVGLGVWLGWLLVLSPFHIYYSQEARPYALWSCLITATFLYLLRFFAAPSKGALFAYAFFALLACYTYTHSVFVVLLPLLLVLVYRPPLERRARFALFIASAIVVLLCLPWFWLAADALAAGMGFSPTRRASAFIASGYTLFSLAFGTSAGPSHEDLRFFGTRVFAEDQLTGATLLLGSLVLGALLLLGAGVLWRTNRNAFYFAAFGLLIFLGTPVCVNLLNPDIPLNPRYALAAIVPLMVFTLAGWHATRKGRHWRRLLPLAFALLIAFSLGNHYFNPRYRRDDLRAAAQFLRALEPPLEHVVVCAAHLVDVFGYYASGDLPLQPLSLATGAAGRREVRDLVERLAQKRRFALVYSRPDHGDREHILPAALQERFRCLDQRHWTGVDAYVFEGPAADAQRE